MALPFVLSSSCIACAFLPLCLPCLLSALASVNITTNCALNAGVLGLVVGVGEALNLDVGVLLKAGDSLLKAGNCRVGSQAYWREILLGS